MLGHEVEKWLISLSRKIRCSEMLLSAFGASFESPNVGLSLDFCAITICDLNISRISTVVIVLV